MNGNDTHGTFANTGTRVRIEDLPSPSPVLAKIRSVVSSEESSARDVADALKLDPVMVGRVLRLANSAYFGMPRTVSNVQNAVALLGQKRIAALAMSVSLSASLRGVIAPSFPIRRFWQHSTAVGLIAEAIGKHVRRYAATDPDDLFAAAVMHDIGKLVLARLAPGALDAAVSRGRSLGRPLHEAEERGSSHAEVGCAAASRWGFPPDLCAGIGDHHTLPPKGPRARGIAVLHLADAMAHAIGLSAHPDEEPPRVSAEALEVVALPLERLRVIAEEVLARQREVESLMAFFAA